MGDNRHAASASRSGDQLVQIRTRPSSPYWSSLEERSGDTGPSGEFPGGLPAPGDNGASRRDFLSLMGFSLGAAGVSACRAPVQNAVPLAVASDALVPGVANHYATTCGGCSAACSLLVKQRDGRPIKIEGNVESPLFGGGVCATGQATVLSLYDEERLRGPLWHGRPASWKEVDERVSAALAATRREGRKTVLLSTTQPSPSTGAIIADWGRQPRFEYVTYDPVSLSALRAAHAELFGAPLVPHYHFDRARVIVGLEADFLGAWLSPVEHARQYALGRRDGGSFHVQCEAGLSVTGSNADLRLAVPPSALGKLAVALLGRVAARAGLEDVPKGRDPVDARQLDRIAEALWRHRGASLVVSGSNDRALQIVVAALNVLLGSPGQTMDLARSSLQRQGDDAAMARLIEEMNAGAVHTLILHGANPLHDHPAAAAFRRGLEKVALSISLSERLDETSRQVHAVCPDHHFLESWGDAEPVASHLSLRQPLIAPLFDTRAAPESLLRWLGGEGNHLAHLRRFWREHVWPRVADAGDFETFWERALQRGVVELPAGSPRQPALSGDWRPAARALLARREAAEYELLAYESVALRDGRHANNPWLQELPDPITKTTWGNHAAIAPALAARLELRDGDVVALRTTTGAIELPVLVQPGQEAHTIAVAIGYGREQAGKVGTKVGVNVVPLLSGALTAVTLAGTGRHQALARTQTHSSLEGRPIALETDDSEPRPELPSLWGERSTGDHSWGMAIDLDACTGCSACVVACQAENNVPVVGKDQVQRARVMHWIRIDRYYRGPADDPAVVHQPMMCQHCGHAPCETVCPVLATTRSSEGLNQQVYNRCIGTRYCANNCPYKVRRFNWYHYADSEHFDFTMRSPLARMVLNPDVVVRSRGVMEKCSLCVQRIQLGKNSALQGRRAVADGDIETACQQTCPTSAIVFGDLADPASRVSRLLGGGRAYRVLEELGTRPNVGYLKKRRHREET